jgi:hypothetical protein
VKRKPLQNEGQDPCIKRNLDLKKLYNTLENNYMDNPEKPLPQLKDLLNLQTTREQFEEVVGQLLSPKDKELFGSGAISKVTVGILYLAPYAPEPATFDREAYKFSVGSDDDGNPLREEEVAQLLQIAKGTGVVKDAPNNRLMVDKDIHPIIEKILSYYE